ncbi:CopG family ribbon-helix-helix protein [Sulfurisphaera tokodaii]|uniref:Nickel responsive regulator n=2 Tax=Sulfurisphaera tokodaii TaxID=111955 RepID=Q970T1_SULTO|nr:CopG family ribbon-helix-helix protein [Sulfurisphaera tokodaii]BAB66592.1 nickel responsive regulator [Sulfurisphaera tokodaii str. 7]HII73590.1 CopG family ribbon-helix-helix protein [Sulfurisphaera tokodaii]
MSEKISISIPRELYERLERYLKEKQIVDRSKIFQIAIRNFLDENESSDTFVYGIINLVYDEDASEVTKFQHEHEDKIISVMHIHVGNECIEALAVKGKKRDLVELTAKLSQLKGVKKVRFIVSTPET